MKIVIAMVLFSVLAVACTSPQQKAENEAAELPKPPCNTAASHSVEGRSPGDVVNSTELTQSDNDPNFPVGARVWRVLYVSTGVDNKDLQLVCGVIVAPKDKSKIQAAGDGDNTGRMVTWSHGTIGLQSRCQPSMTPEANIWGPMPGGFNVVAWGKDGKTDGRLGKPAFGALQYMIDQGWVVAATDYFADLTGGDKLEPYIIGKTEASNTIDSARAAHQLLSKDDDEYGIDKYDYLTWGHSQGGHSAAWSAQLVDDYVKATKKSDQDVTFALRGAALLAPATTIVVDAKEQPYTADHYGFADWTVHQKMGASTILGKEVGGLPLAPALFSFILGAWEQQSNGQMPSAAEMPAFPVDLPNLNIEAVTTPTAAKTVDKITPLCLEAEPLKVFENVLKYDVEPFFVEEISDGPVIDGQKHGNLDVICSGKSTAELDKWCDWIKYQIPGPIGTSKLSKLPVQDGKLVPVYIADGSNDFIIQCRAPNEEQDVLPDAKQCMSHAFYDAMKDGAYCPAGKEAAGYLKLDIWQKDPNTTTAGHFEVPGLASAKNLNDPQFEGSPLHSFMTDAFDQKLKPECVKPKLMNPTSNPTGAAN